MPENKQNEIGKVDFRVYLGIILFRWKLIVVCFVWCLLGAVLYIDFVPSQYLAECRVRIYRDPVLTLSTQTSMWKSINMHMHMLSSRKQQDRIVRLLTADWGKKIGSLKNMYPKMNLQKERGLGSVLNISVTSRNREYGKVFLSTLLSEHKKQWQGIQMETSKSAAKLLEGELARLDENIKTSEDNLIEYCRLNEIARVEAASSMESRYLEALMERRNQITTELIILEAEYPMLKNAGVGVVSYVDQLTRQTAEVKPEALIEKLSQKDSEGTMGYRRSVRKLELPSALGNMADDAEELRGWRELQVKLIKLQKKEKDYLADFTSEYPKLKSVRAEIDDIKNQLEEAASIQVGKMKDRQSALKTHLSALERAEYQWHNKNQQASMRHAELKRISDILKRYEDNYRTLYGRLHDMRVSQELKAEHFELFEPVEALPDQVWPDTVKILIMALGLGLGSGIGLVFLVQILDNRIQSVSDVEKELGVPFLGGIPYWAHSGLENNVRPIVTEEHSTGAIEAYRALRTSVLSALSKINEKIVLVTSTDSKEGKTLTSLNLAIMTAQMGKKVLLVDLDLRRGRLHKSLGCNRDHGMTEVMKGEKQLEDVVVKTRQDNLFFVSTGGSVEDAAELLQSVDLKRIFAEACDEYDYIFVDTSPVLRVTDTVILTTHEIGVVLYVAHVSRTPKPLIRYSLDTLKDANILGLVMNSIELHKFSSLYYTYQYPNYAYYSNAYAYGYDYYYDDRDGKSKPHKHLRSTWSRRRSAVKKWFYSAFFPDP
ncbi:polysaccharide biosynthesis tyrosine autokinase [Verrucomicrobiota bacterium]